MNTNRFTNEEIDSNVLWNLLQNAINDKEKYRLADVFRIIAFNSNETFGPHEHHRIEINYVKKGNCILHLKDESVTFREGEMMIIGSHTEHMFQAGNHGVTLMQLEFIPELFEPLPLNQCKGNTEKEGDANQRVSFFTEKNVFIKVINDMRIMHVIQNIISELHFQKDNYQQLVLISYAELYILINRYLKESYFPMCKNEVLQNSIQYIKDNYHKAITIAQIAAHSNISERYLRKLFAQYLKLSPLDYLNRFRINKAVELLRNTNLSIKEVCYLCGFQSPQYFSRVFKHQTGTSPKKFNQG